VGISPAIIFFDFDGVIVESVDLKIAAFRNLYTDHGEDVIAKVLDHHAAHGGISRVVKIRECHRMFLNIELSEPALMALAGAYADFVEEAVVACDSVPGAMDLLKSNDGARHFYIVSGTPENELRRITEGRGISGYFDAVYGSPRHKEEIVEGVLERHGASAGDAMFIGDTMTDFSAAEATRVPFVGRVPPHHASPFPAGTVTVTDMTGLAAHIATL